MPAVAHRSGATIPGPGRSCVHVLMALLAYTGSAAIGMDPVPDAGWLAALGAEQGHVGNVDGRLPLDHAELRVDVARAPLMLLNQVYAGDDDTIALGITLACPA